MRLISVFVVFLLMTACTAAPRDGCPAAASPQQTGTAPLKVSQVDYSAIRGANYCAAGGNHNDHWNNYDPKETERDLDYAKKISINQVRVFLSYPAYAADPAKFRKNLIHLAGACQARGIGL